MNTILSYAAVAVGLSVPVAMIVGNHLARQRRETTRPATAEEIARNADTAAIEKGICPNCGDNGSLLAGPNGGMSQNIACGSCLEEFNVHFGFGTGALQVDRSGKMTAERARVFGITPQEYRIATGYCKKPDK